MYRKSNSKCHAYTARLLIGELAHGPIQSLVSSIRFFISPTNVLQLPERVA